jgi:hypothetical protein
MHTFWWKWQKVQHLCPNRNPQPAALGFVILDTDIWTGCWMGSGQQELVKGVRRGQVTA